MNPGAKKVHRRSRSTDSGTVSRSLFSSIDQAVWKATGKSAEILTTSWSMPPSSRAMYSWTDSSESLSQLGRLVQQEGQILQGFGELVGLGFGQAGCAAADEGDGLVAGVDRHLQQFAVVLAPLGVARGDQDVAGSGGDEVVDLVGLVRAVQDQQPAGVRVAPAQRVAYGAQPFAVLRPGRQAQLRCQFGQSAPVGDPLLGVDPPDHVVLGAEAVDVLGGELGLADAGHAVQRDHARARLGALEQVVGVVQERLAAGEAGVATRHSAPDLGHRGREAGAAPGAFDGLGERFGGQVEAFENAALGLVGAHVVQVDRAEDGGGRRQRAVGDGDGREAGRVGRDDLAQRGVPLLVGARAELEVPLADDDQDAALGQGQVPQQVDEGHLGRGVPALVHHALSTPLQTVPDPGRPGPVETGEADGDGLLRGPPFGWPDRRTNSRHAAASPRVILEPPRGNCGDRAPTHTGRLLHGSFSKVFSDDLGALALPCPGTRGFRRGWPNRGEA